MRAAEGFPTGGKLVRKLFFLILVSTLLAGPWLGDTALAHSRPVRFNPAPGAILESAPALVQGWFTSDIRRDDSSFIRVYDSSKKSVDAGLNQLSSDRRSITAPLQPGLLPGAYLVHWSTFDDVDGEVFSGCYLFFVGQAAADAAVRDGKALDGGADCPASSSESEAATVTISGVEVTGSSATVSMSTENFTIRGPDGSSHESGFGHYHIYLDKVPVDVLEGHSHDEAGEMAEGGHHDSAGDASGLAENPVMWAEDTYTFKDLSPGIHTVSVALFYDDHSPVSPPALASETFEIAGADSGGGGVATWLVIVGLLAAVAIGLAGGRYFAKEG